MRPTITRLSRENCLLPTAPLCEAFWAVYDRGYVAAPACIHFHHPIYNGHIPYYKERAKEEIGHLQEVTGPDVRRMIVQERGPVLSPWRGVRRTGRMYF